jgi:transcriptional repressor NrdR
MYCPFCHAEDTKVTDSRLVGDGLQVRRRRECLSCGERYTTYEKAELALPQIVKRDGQREAFKEEKLRLGLQRALEKRYVEADKIDSIIDLVKQRLRSSGEREMSAKVIGQWVMAALRELDEVAYVRFASVYRRFEDVSEFNKEIERIQNADADTPQEV